MRPKVEGEYQFKGEINFDCAGIDPVQIPNWSPVKVFYRPETERLNAKVTREDGLSYTNWIGAFHGEWRSA